VKVSIHQEIRGDFQTIQDQINDYLMHPSK